MRELLKFYIDGEWVDPVKLETLDVENPANETIAGKLALGSAMDVDVGLGLLVVEPCVFCVPRNPFKEFGDRGIQDFLPGSSRARESDGRQEHSGDAAGSVKALQEELLSLLRRAIHPFVSPLPHGVVQLFAGTSGNLLVEMTHGFLLA